MKKSKRVVTTKYDPVDLRPSYLVRCDFTADAPRRLWVSDVICVATWPGFTNVAFAADVCSSRIVGWNVASMLRADVLPLQELEQAAWDAGGDLIGLTQHSDHGSNHMALVYTDRVIELGAIPSTRTVGDSYDNTLAEAIDNLYKIELIRQRSPRGPSSRSSSV